MDSLDGLFPVISFLVVLLTINMNLLIFYCVTLAGSRNDWYAPPGIEDHKFNPVVDCGEKPKEISSCFKKPNFCLFNIKEDPCEYHDLSEKHPDILQKLICKLDQYRASAVPSRLNLTVDPLCNPKLYNGVWRSWRKPLPEN